MSNLTPDMRISEIFSSSTNLAKSHDLLSIFYTNISVDNYFEMEKKWKSIIKIVNNISHLKLETINITFLEIIEDFLKSVTEFVTFIRTIEKDFPAKMSVNDDIEELQAIIKEKKQNSYKEVSNKIDTIINNVPYELYTLITYELINNDTLSNLIEEFNKKKQELINKKNELEDLIKEKKDEHSHYTKLLKEAGSSVSTSKFKHLYFDLANEMGKNSMIWIFGMLIISLLILFYAFDLLTYESILRTTKIENNIFNQSISNVNELIKIDFMKIFKRIIIFSTLFFALTFCAKNYRLSKHNQLINIHRAYALSTFEMFIENAATNNNLKANVIQETTNLIFSEPNPGYLNEGNSNKENSKIIELLINQLTKYVK